MDLAGKGEEDPGQEEREQEPERRIAFDRALSFEIDGDLVEGVQDPGDAGQAAADNHGHDDRNHREDDIRNQQPGDSFGNACGEGFFAVIHAALEEEPRHEKK